jgi:hypothetical protein
MEHTRFTITVVQWRQRTTLQADYRKQQKSRAIRLIAMQTNSVADEVAKGGPNLGQDGILGIKLHNAVPEGVNQQSESHGSAGMALLRLLCCIHRKRTNGVDTKLIQFGVCSWMSKLCWTHDCLSVIE